MDTRSLSEHPELVGVVSGWHWKEWGPDCDGESLDDWSHRVANRAEPDAIPFTIIAFVDGEAVGSVSACWDDHRAGFPTGEPWLSGMVVRNEARNLGVGRALLGATERRCRELGFHRVWLHTGEANRFYERCGWTLVRDKESLHDDAVLCRDLEGAP